MHRYLAFRVRFGFSLHEDENARPQYRLVREEDVKTGLYVPASHPDVEPEPRFTFDAANDREAKQILDARVEEDEFF